MERLLENSLGDPVNSHQIVRHSTSGYFVCPVYYMVPLVSLLKRASQTTMITVIKDLISLPFVFESVEGWGIIFGFISIFFEILPCVRGQELRCA